jgi:magnesium chelatase family protein
MNHTLIIGPPGSNKIALAREIAAEWPFPLGESEPDRAFTWRAAGLEPDSQVERHKLYLKPPFRAPHHTVSEAGMRGTFRKDYQWRPGEVSLAHGGTLLLDELPEFRRDALQVVYKALLSGSIKLFGSLTDRGQANIIAPARFRLVCTMNPCPCGHRGCPRLECRCTEEQVKRYLSRVPSWVRSACKNVVDKTQLESLNEKADQA